MRCRQSVAESGIMMEATKVAAQARNGASFLTSHEER